MKSIYEQSLKISLIAVTITIISDFILIGRPNSSWHFFELGTASMAVIPIWRITLGTFIGVLAIPFQGLGLISVYHGLKNGGKVAALAAVLLLFHALSMAIAFHMSYAYIGGGHHLSNQWGNLNLHIQDMMNQFHLFWTWILIIVGVEIAISSFLFSWLIIRNNTLYPKWMALFNPAFILVYTYLIILPVPYPIGGYLAPAFLNISTFVFMTLSFKTIKNSPAL